MISHLDTWVVSKRRSYVLLVVWQGHTWDFAWNFILFVLKREIAVSHNFLFLCSIQYIITETCFCLFAFRHLQVWSTMIREGFLYLPHTVCRRSGWQICTEL
jgi:hypothetical protein